MQNTAENRAERSGKLNKGVNVQYNLFDLYIHT